MIVVLNFSGHPMAPEVQSETARLLGEHISVRELSRQFDLNDLPNEMLRAVMDAGFSVTEWQATPFVVMVPTLGVAAAGLCATIHGITGSFPRVVWLQQDPQTRTFTVPRLLDLAALREAGRLLRFAE